MLEQITALFLSNLFIIKIPIIISFFFLYSSLKERNNLMLDKNKTDILNHYYSYPKLIWFLLLIPFLGEIWFIIMAFLHGKKLNLIEQKTFVPMWGILNFPLSAFTFKMIVFSLCCILYNYFLFELIEQSMNKYIIYYKYYAQLGCVFCGVWLFLSNFLLSSHLKTEVKHNSF